MTTPVIDSDRQLSPWSGAGGLADVPLADLWRMVAERRRLVAAVTLIGTLAAAGLAVLSSPRYRYSSTIEIAAVDGRLVDNTETAMARLTETYVPEARSAYGAAHPDQQSRIPRLTVRTSPGSALVVLESEGAATDAPLHTELHQAIVSRLAADHRRTLDEHRSILERQRSTAERESAQMRAEGDQLKVPGGPLSPQERLLAGQLLALRAWLVSSTDRTTEALLASIRETRALAPPRRSDAPVNASRLAVIASGTAGGAAAGALVALAAGLMRRGARPR